MREFHEHSHAGPYDQKPMMSDVLWEQNSELKAVKENAPKVAKVNKAGRTTTKRLRRHTSHSR